MNQERIKVEISLPLVPRSHYFCTVLDETDEHKRVRYMCPRHNFNNRVRPVFEHIESVNKENYFAHFHNKNNRVPVELKRFEIEAEIEGVRHNVDSAVVRYAADNAVFILTLAKPKTQ